MVKIIAAAALAMMAAPSQFPSQARVELLEIHSQKHILSYSGYGKGNVIDSDGKHRFDFAFDHCGLFDRGKGMGYWNAPQRLTIVLPVIGTTRSTTCVLRVTEQPN